MDIAGIVCEFDPFHNGHAYLLRRVREQGASGIVCVMSGDFVQRGGPAVLDKFRRAEAAVRCGADLVLELPAVYSVNSADWFAKGAVRILKGLGCVDTIAFGSECGESGKLLDIACATAFEPPEFSDALKACLADGMSYPAAYRSALEQVFPAADVSVLDGPNDILAVCYLREIVRQGSDIVPFAVMREGAAHGSSDPEGEIASASFIRGELQSGSGRWKNCVPEPVRQLLEEADLSPEALSRRKDRLFAVIRHALLTGGSEALEGLPEISEGLENRILSAVRTAEDLDGLISGIVTGRYTASRAMRVLTQLILGLSKDLVSEADQTEAAYARVLAFNNRGAELLKDAKEKGDLPVYSNINKNVPTDAPERKLLDVDISSGDTYSIICGRAIAEYSDKVQIPNMLKI